MHIAPPIVALIVIVIFIIVVLVFIPSSPSKLRATAQLRDVVEVGEVSYFDSEEQPLMSGFGIPVDGDFYARPLFHTKGGTKRVLGDSSSDERAAFMGATTLGSQEAIAIWGNLSSSRKCKYLGLTGYVYDLNVASRRQSLVDTLSDPLQSLALATPETSSPGSERSRKVVLASLADSVSISEVNGPVCVIMTPNQNLIAPLRRKLLSTPGFPSNSTFKVIPIPSSVYKDSYRYTLLLQVASQQGTAIQSSVKMSRPQSNITEFTEIQGPSPAEQEKSHAPFRGQGPPSLATSQSLTRPDLPTFKTIRYENIAVSHEAFNDVRLKSRGNNQLESSLFSGSNPTQTLIDEATQLLTNQGYQLVNRLNVTPFLGADLGPQGLDNGFQCLSKILNCEGENRDRTVFQTQQTVIAKGDKVAVLAIDHASSRKAIYSTVTFSSSQSVISSSDSDNTARHLTQITGDTQSIEPIPSLISKLIVYEPDANSDISIVVTEKVYLEPLSKIGPAVQELMPMTVFIIKRSL